MIAIIQRLNAVDDRQNTINKIQREIREKNKSIENKQANLRTRNVEKLKQELRADRLKDVRLLVDTNRKILNEIKESIDCTIRYVCIALHIRGSQLFIMSYFLWGNYLLYMYILT